MARWDGSEEGFTQGEVRRWRAARFGPEEAAAWRAAGVTAPADARLWRTAAATPDTVIVWQRAGMTPVEAVRWHELGVAPHDAARRHLAGERPRRVPWLARLAWLAAPEPAAEPDPALAEALRRLLRAGVPADVARAYADAGWPGAEAEEWARRRVDQGDARVFRALGFTAAEAARTGLPAVEVMAAWWGAVPMAEVATWCAAGFTPEEAAGQRAAGVTADRARVLRALSAFGPDPA
ncbi:hypothetical protein [Nonomuraea sp. NPDC049709]|uniref:hypothetical protein n=1 Tax=Nonomuraea sp. NPDC049709 TaxID=3154736 RepID=UPI00343B0C88